MSVNNQREHRGTRPQSGMGGTRKRGEVVMAVPEDSKDPNAATFPSVPPTPPTKKDYIRMISFVSLYLVLVFVVCVLIWVIQDSAVWKQRLLFCTTSILEALIESDIGCLVAKGCWAQACAYFC